MASRSGDCSNDSAMAVPKFAALWGVLNVMALSIDDPPQERIEPETASLN